MYAVYVSKTLKGKNTFVGMFKNLEDAAAHMVEETVTYEPRPQMHEKYMKEFARYQKMYDAIRPLV